MKKFLSILIFALTICTHNVIFCAPTIQTITGWLKSQQNADGSWNLSYDYYPLDNQRDTFDATADTEYNLWMGDGATGSIIRLSSSFTPTQNYSCSKAILLLKQTYLYENEPITGVFQAYIYSNSAGLPNTLLGTSNKLVIEETLVANGSPTEVEFIFPQPIALSANTPYSIAVGATPPVLNDPNTREWIDYNNKVLGHIQWCGVENTESTPSARWYMTGGVRSWQAINYNLCFKIYSEARVKTSTLATASYKDPLSTLVVTNALLNAKVPTSDATMQKALKWIATQEFNNTDYLSRQIEVLSKANLNTDLLRDKLLSFQNNDNGWGENQNYKTNCIDTVWAIKALLSQNDTSAIAQDAFSILLASSNEDSGQNSRWSIFKPSSTANRVDSSVISSYVYDALKTLGKLDCSDGDTIISLIDPNSTVRNSVQTYLLTTLQEANKTPDQTTNIINHVQETAVIVSTLTKHAITDTSVSERTAALANMLNSAGHYNSNPFLTALILDSMTATQNASVTISSLDVVNNELRATLSTSASVTAQFFIKKLNDELFQLLASQENTTSSNLVTTPIPSDIQEGDILAVKINFQEWAEVVYSPETNCDIAIYAKDIVVCESSPNDKELYSPYPNNTLIKQSGASQDIRVKLKIHNNSNFKIKNISGSIQSSIFTNQVFTITEIMPLQDFILYSDPVTISSNDNSTISVSIAVNDTQYTESDTGNNTASTTISIVVPQSSSPAIPLDAPLNANYQYISANAIKLFWDAPFDSEIIGYQIENASNSSELYTTIDTSCNISINSTPVTYNVYSMNDEGKRSQDYDSVTVIAFEETIEITYPVPNQELIALKSMDTDLSPSQGLSLIIEGTATYPYYKVVLSKNSTLIDQSDHKSTQYYGQLHTFDLSGTNITSGSYNVTLEAYDSVDGSVVESVNVPITIEKWEQKSIIRENTTASYEASHPCWDDDASEVMFAYRRDKQSNSEIDVFWSNLWTWKKSDQSKTLLDTNVDFTDESEPAWYNSSNVVYTSYETGAKNLIHSSVPTGTKNVISVFVDNDGNLVDENSGYQKSFYNPDVVDKDTTHYLVSSDERGELVLIVTNDYSEVDLYNLTLNMNEEDNKDFTLADNPQIWKSSDTQMNILFEGYKTEIPEEYENESYYINSDMYNLRINIPVKKETADFGVTTSSGTNNYGTNYLYAAGPFTANLIGEISELQIYINSIVAEHTCNIQLALYSNSTSNTPDQLLATTTQRILESGAYGQWISLPFSNACNMTLNQKYWVVLHFTAQYAGSGTASTVPMNLSDSTNNPSVSLYRKTSSTAFPESYPNDALVVNNVCFLARSTISTPTNLAPSLTKLTDTKHVSEYSPVWLIGYRTGTNMIGYVCDKDMNNDDNPNWNIHFAVFSSSGISNDFALTNTSATGIYDQLNFRNNHMAFQEKSYTNGMFVYRLWYLEKK
ncbi:MAG: hypothetical protein AB1454_14565 [Candidatus Auribacterota bacterium]